MKILIAGGNGLIGTYLNKHLNEPASIISIDYSNRTVQNNFVKLDLTDNSQVTNFAENTLKFDILIFLIGLAHAKGKGKDLPVFEKVNYQTLVNLLSAFNNEGKTPAKIIFASTISVYGERYDQNDYDETLEPNPFSPYAVTKLQAEQYLLDNFLDNSWILRFAPVYSPDFMLNINRRIKMLGANYKIGKGTKKISLCNIENIKTTVEGIIAGAVPAGIYNISDPVAYTYNDLLNHQGSASVFHIPALVIRLMYILGDGRMKKWAKREIKDLGLEGNCHFLGSHPLAEMPKFYSNADAMLFSLKKEYIYSITIPAKVQSYFACGKPILAMVDGEASTLVRDAKAGLTCGSGDTEGLAKNILKLSKYDKEIIINIGLNAYKYYQANFEREMLFQKAEIIFNTLVSRMR